MRPLVLTLILAVTCVLAHEAASPEVLEELFLKWAPENGIVGAEKLMFVPVGASGDRGLAARVRLEPDETIVQIPPNMILSILSLQDTPFEMLWKELRRKGPGALRNELRPAEDKALEQPQPFEGVVQTNMLALYLCHLIRYPDTHRWGHYVRTLPAPEEMTQILLWDKFELNELRGTSLHLEAEELHKDVRSNFEFFSKLLASRYRHLFAAPLSLEEFIYAHAIIASRDFGVEKSRAALCLMPINDLANHVLHGRHNYYYKKAEDGSNNMLMVVGGKAIEAGEELLNTYGHQPNYNLMKLYGFSLERNPNDALYLSPPIKEPFSALKAEWAHRAVYDELALRMTSIDRTLGFLRVIFATHPRVFENEEFRMRVIDGQLIDWTIERDVLDFVKKAIDLQLEALMGRIEDQPHYHDDLSNPRVREAVRYRSREHRFFKALKAAIEAKEERGVALGELEPPVCEGDMSDPNAKHEVL